MFKVGLTNFSLKVQRINILGFVGRTDMKTNGLGCVPVKLYLQNKFGSQA